MKPAAKELMKNKSAMARVRNERLFQNVMTRRSDMTKAGNRRKPEMLKLNKKKLAAKPNNNNQNKKPAAAAKKPAAVVNKVNKNAFAKSMNVYKTQLAIPFAKTGLHDPKSPGYHDELVRNMKNLADRRKNIVPMHNKAWFVEQLKRNVWALRNNKPVALPITPAVSRCGPTKTQKLLKDRAGKKVTKPKAMSSKKLLEQLKSIKPVR
jgi:hypothetical protein